MSTKPDFFIVGAPRSGTTAMAQFLGNHPQIFMARKEMHLFGADLKFGRRFYRRNLQTYAAAFEARNGHRLAGEGSVWYLFSTRAAAEIKRFNPEARIIIMLREPVEMLFSLYHEFRFDGNEHLPTFESALAAEDERRAGQRLTHQTYFAQGLVYREVVRYSEQVQRYFSEFGRDRVQVLLYDDFAGDPGAAYHRTVQFLGLRPELAEQSFEVVNGSKRVRSPLLQKVMGDRWLRSIAISLARPLPQPLFRFLQLTEEKIWRSNARFVQRQPMAQALRAQLALQLSAEVERLARVLERDLACWSWARNGITNHCSNRQRFAANPSPSQAGGGRGEA